MERFELVPDEIIGTSMGGIIGACVAIAMRAEQITTALEKFAGVSNWLDINLRGNSIINIDEIKALGKGLIEKLISP